MSSRLLLLAVAVASASLPQKATAPSQDELKNVCMELDSDLEEVLGITSKDNTLVVGSRSNIRLYSVSKSIRPCRLEDSIKLPLTIEKFTELKLLDASTLFYCDSQKCFACVKIGKTWTCKEQSIRSANKSDGDITYATATLNQDRINVRVAFTKGRATIYSFEAGGTSLLDEDALRSDRSAHDLDFIKDHKVVQSFSDGGYSFFVSSSEQPYEPYIMNKHDLKAHRVIVKITRICNRDKTKNIESRIDISLSCFPLDPTKISEVGASYFDESSKRLFVSFTSGEEEAVCAYDLDEMNRRIDRTWDVCQNTTFMSQAAECEYNTVEKIPEHCYTVTRMGDGGRMLACSMFASNAEGPKYENCKLDAYISTAYRYGWLENFLPIEGSLIARVSRPNVQHSILLLPDRRTSALFIASEDRIARVPASFAGVKDKKNEVATFAPLQAIWPSTRFPIAHVDENGYMYIVNNKVVQAKIVCPALYDTCEALLKGGFHDSLGCAFCPDDEGGGKVIPSHDKALCAKPLFYSCPPIIDHAYRNPSVANQWVVNGINLQNMPKAKLLVCNQSCDIDHNKRTDTGMICHLPSGTVDDMTCPLTMVGQLESHHDFIIRPRTVDSGSQTEKATSGNKSLTPTWKVVIGIVAVLLILAILALILFGARKLLAMRNQKADGSLGVPFDTMSSYPRSGQNRNTYVPNFSEHMETDMKNEMMPFSPYEKLFHDIDERLKIPSEHLHLERQIGRGHFGIVIKGTYLQPDGSRHEVACKTLQDNIGGIAEFMNEGLMMDRFDHPRVMTLVGISFTDHKRPIIVTDYMENGDLAKYLRNEKNRPTLRHLLVFGIEIAEGMAYLHDNKFIHRDLAARNCMLDGDLHVKVADFGLCREATNMEYAPLHHGRELPLRWMAPEALEHEQFTMQGDVWAFGVVLWEIMTRGMLPYQSVKTFTILDFIKAGNRLGNPNFCPELLYEVMLDCWESESYKRPSFDDLPERILNIIYILENDARRTLLSAEYEQSNSVRNSRATSSSATTTPITHHAVNQVQSLPQTSVESVDPTPV